MASVYNSMAASNSLASNALLPSSLTLSAPVNLWVFVSGGGEEVLATGTFIGELGRELGELTSIACEGLLTMIQYFGYEKLIQAIINTTRTDLCYCCF